MLFQMLLFVSLCAGPRMPGEKGARSHWDFRWTAKDFFLVLVYPLYFWGAKLWLFIAYLKFRFNWAPIRKSLCLQGCWPGTLGQTRINSSKSSPPPSHYYKSNSWACWPVVPHDARLKRPRWSQALERWIELPILALPSSNWITLGQLLILSLKLLIYKMWTIIVSTLKSCHKD